MGFSLPVRKFEAALIPHSGLHARRVAHWSGGSDAWCAGEMSVSLADFSEPGFDCKQWVNTACARCAPINRWVSRSHLEGQCPLRAPPWRCVQTEALHLPCTRGLTPVPEVV